MRPAPLSRIIYRLLFNWMVLPCIMLMSVICVSLTLQQEQDIKQLNEAVASSLDRFVQTYVDDAAHTLDYLARLAPIMDEQDFHKALMSMHQSFRHFELVARVDENMQVLDSDLPEVIGREMVLQREISDPSIPRVLPLPTMSPETGSLVIYAYSPAADGTYIVGELALNSLQEFLSAFRQHGEDNAYSIILTDRHGNLISHPDGRLVREQANMGHLEPLRRVRDARADHTMFFEMGEEYYLGSVSSMDKTGWALMVAKPVSAMIVPIAETVGVFLMFVIAGYGALVFILRREIRKRLLTPLTALTEAVSRTVAGDGELKLPPQPVEELQTISRRFKATMDQVDQRESELIRARQEYATILDNIPDGFYRADMDGNLTMLNQTAANMLGYDDPEELLGKNIAMDFYKYPEERRKLQYVLETAGRVRGHRATLLRKDGSDVEMESNTQVVFDKDTGEPVAVEGIARDVTERIRTAKALERFRFALDNSGDALFLIDREGLRFVDANKTACDSVGYSQDELLEMGPVDIKPGYTTEQLAEELDKALDKQDPHVFDTVHRRKDGSTFPVEISLRSMPHEKGNLLIASVRDMSERKKTQELLIQTEKMMSVGGLAAGMAHEINNPLGIILQGAQLITKRLSPELPKNHEIAQEAGIRLEQVEEYMNRREIFSYLEGIRDAGARAANIVANMLDFSRKSESSVAYTDINDLLDKSLDLAAKDYDLKKKYDFRSIEVVRQYQQDLPQVPCTATEIQQVFINLMKNSAQAMSEMHREGHTSTLTLRTARDGDFILVELEDNGPGMNEETKKRVFEPFFTTKPPGVGTGLGLSVSYFIITQNHGGTFSVDSAPGRGTTFSMRLPLLRQMIEV